MHKTYAYNCENTIYIALITFRPPFLLLPLLTDLYLNQLDVSYSCMPEV